MFEREPTASYMMPAHFGPRYMGPTSTGWYHDVTAMSVSYVTDRKRLAALLPERFEVAETPVISVFYACNRNIDWLAGHGYNMIGVKTDVIYRGEEETLEGAYSLVIWENLTDPILAGRELQGIPKIYADIPDHSINGGTWRCNASHFGHKIMDMEITNIRAPELEELAAAGKANEGKDNPMAWRYLQKAGELDPRVDEYTTFPSEDHITQIMLGEGTLDWSRLTWEQNPTQFHIVNAMKDLPILEYRPAAITKGSTNLFLPNRMTRVLK
jgi:acetoacetate decarboxylase